MSLDPNMVRWIRASVSDYIIERCQGTPAPENVITFVEGLDKDSNPKDAAEFRMDGPRFNEQSSGYWNIWIAVNILVQHTMNKSDFYAIDRNIGKCVYALDTSIPVYKYGDDPSVDDESYIGCFTVIQSKFDRIQVNKMGQVDPALKLEQATVEARYQMYFSEG
jgi:hypothetical protein